jgi:Flp pilus assembly protein TadD
VAPPPPPPVAAPEPDAHALVEEGLALYKKGRLKQATQKLEEAQKLDAPGALVALARCHLDLGADAKALAEAERATHENPRDAEAWLIVGTVEQQRSRAADAKTAYKKYLELSPRGAFAGEVRAILRSL